ncbi:hypothetical protein EZS27_023450 [termite gut metagenome]|uniref:Uncharacterized protein n=1 Tax=termite gut metagenome TaxID=433724 RepID=A0A5J4R1J3_9ZZZZ
MLGYIKGTGIWYKAELNTIKKKEESPLHPVFEAFTNSLEAILIKKKEYSSDDNGEINISLHLVKDLLSNEDNKYRFNRIVVEDSGIGFTDKEFERFINLRDDRKNFFNKGTGRIQFIHAFDKTKIASIYHDNKSSTGYKKREMTLSKSDIFLNQNAIIRLDKEEDIIADRTSTTIILETLLNTKENIYFSTLTTGEVKNQLIRHYLAEFCENRNNLPKIMIKSYIDDHENSSLEITSDDIPTPDKIESIDIYYSKIINNNIEKTSNKETFTLRAFLIAENELDKNELKLISKGEIAKDVKLDKLLPTDIINGKRFLFLLSGQYIDERDSDTRGEIDIPLRKEFKKRNSDFLSSEEAILLEEIEEKTNQKIISLYEEIEEKNIEREKSIEELQEMFLLNPQTLKSLQNKINIGDSDEIILRKVYESDAKIIAKKDAEIKQQIKDLEQLVPNRTDDYSNQLRVKINEFVKSIPIQNRTALTQYVARRKLVLELFQKILDKELIKLKNGGRIDEDLMHNLIFQQSSDDPENSDLWLINEDFIYFKGTSESKLGDIQFNGESIFKDKLSTEEEEYRFKQNGDAKQKRTDILLFPKEGKCIIIELKAPEINVSDHLNQINRYASLINNLSKDSFKFTTYYGYLIGESVDVDDIADSDSDFKSAFNLGFIFRPYKRIIGKFGKNDGGLYTEIIKYSTLLERANQRNKIFIEKLEKGNKPNQ